MARIVDISSVDPITFELQDYTPTDDSLISNSNVDINFDPAQDYIEYFVYSLDSEIIYQNTAGLPNYSLLNNELFIDPELDLESSGFLEGEYYTLYNFLKRKLSSSPNSTFYIQDISSDRTELRLNTTTISNLDIIELTAEFSSQISNNTGSYLDFCLNFGDNQLVIANNIALDNINPNDPTVLIKLYEPLPEEFDLQSQCWVVERIADSIAYDISITETFEEEEILNYIQGPNFNLPIQDQINNSTPYYNQNTLTQNTSLLGSGSLLYQINSLLAEKGIEINIDYSNYSQFIHFSSAQTRLENFYYKLSLIEEYTVSSSYSNGTPLNYYVSSSQNIWNNKINEIITNFDGYEYYLYFNSESHAWPKTNSVFPYINYSTTSPTAIAWLTTQSISASYFDSENKDNLLNTIPTYLREDDNNTQYFLFTQMIGQHFDNVWVYLKDINNKFDADNRLDYGISRDLVAQAIRDLGIKIYQNNFSSTDLYSALLGLTPSGSLLNIPNITGSLPVPSGSGLEYINTVITASDINALKPLDDINKEIYKRIYHNIPSLLKRKGTPASLEMLLYIYGIPDTIVRINEFGGTQTNQNNNWNNFVEQFNYEFFTTSSGYVNVPLTIFTGSGLGMYGSASYGMDYYGGDSFNQGITSSFTIEFRFKTTGIPENTGSYNQIVAYAPENNFIAVLEYTGSGYTSGSYSGSIVDPYNTWGTLKVIDLSNTNNSSSVYLPFFNGDWWSVMYNLGTIEQNWILTTGYWDDNGYWIDNEVWID